MQKRCTIGAILIAIVILGALLIPNNKIRRPALAKITVTALAEENGFDEREVKPVKEKNSKKTSWTTALLWLIFIAGVIDVVFLKKDSTLSNKIGERANRFSQGSQNNQEIGNADNAASTINTTNNSEVRGAAENTNSTVNTNSARGGDTDAEL